MYPTPGEWAVSDHNRTTVIVKPGVVVHPSEPRVMTEQEVEELDYCVADWFICQCDGADCSGYSVRPLSEREANARLIAAAKDLLEACEELRDAFMDGCGDAITGPKRRRLVHAGEMMDAAIAKAREGAKAGV